MVHEHVCPWLQLASVVSVMLHLVPMVLCFFEKKNYPVYFSYSKFEFKKSDQNPKNRAAQAT